MVDTSKLILYSPYNAFKNNNFYSGTLTISGSTAGGVNTKTFTVNLAIDPDMTDIVFYGPSDASDPRPNDGWFKQGRVWVPTNNAGGGNPSAWTITSSIVGTVLTVTATYIQQFTTAETLTATDFYYRLVDYSVL